jgi:hypothetical protein
MKIFAIILGLPSAYIEASRGVYTHGCGIFCKLAVAWRISKSKLSL